MKVDKSAVKIALHIAGVAGIAMAVTGCGLFGSSAASTDSWCNRGNRLYQYYDGSGSSQLEVVPEATDCPPNNTDDGGVLGDTTPNPNTRIANRPARPDWRLSPEAR